MRPINWEIALFRIFVDKALTLYTAKLTQLEIICVKVNVTLDLLGLNSLSACEQSIDQY